MTEGYEFFRELEQLVRETFTPEEAALIEKATENGIPVVTVLSDCVSSSRKSFIGLNNYSLGSEYGEELALIGEEKMKYPLTALILLDRDDGNYDDIVHAAIQESVAGRNIILTSSVVDTSDPFASEEDVMSILDGLDKIPDVIICLNDRTSESVYQCIVDKNLVGKTTILGYYDSDTILKAIDKGSVYATAIRLPSNALTHLTSTTIRGTSVNTTVQVMS